MTAKEYYHLRKSHGVCVQCGCNEDAVPGKTRCQRHLDDDAKRKKNRTAAQKARWQKWRRAKYNKLKRDGLCLLCQLPTMAGKVYCTFHRLLDARKSMKKRTGRTLKQVHRCSACQAPGHRIETCPTRNEVW